MGLKCRNIPFLFLMSHLFESALGTFELVAFDGDNVTLSCANSSTVYPGWSGPDLTGRIVTYNYHAVSKINPYLGEKSSRLTWDTQNNKSLIIQNVNKRDSGMYSCDTFGVGFTVYNLSVRVRPLKPEISNKEVLDDGANIIRGTMDHHVTLTCTSVGGFPKPKLKWFRHNNQTQSLNSNTTYVIDADGNYIVEQTYTFTPTRQDDMVLYLCQSFFDFPHFYQEDEVKLLLNLKPMSLSITTYPVEEGISTKAALCTAGQYRPNTAVVRLQIDGDDITGDPEIRITKDVTTETFSIVALFKLVMNRNNSGQSVSCHLTHGTLQTPQIVTGIVTVHYAPDIEVTATNVTVFDTAVLTCNPSGLPAVYTYTNWSHTWPGHGTVTHTRTLGNHQTLTLTPLTYESSGVYHCSASNGVNGSLNPNAGHGATFLQVGTFPIILTPSPIHTSTTFQNDTSVTIHFYSNRRNNKVECSRNSTKVNCTSFLEDVGVSLPVFDSIVRAKGLAAKIFWSIQENSHFGTFTVTISNDVGASMIDVDVLESETIQEEQTPGIALLDVALGSVVSVIVVIVCITIVVVCVQRKRRTTDHTRRKTSLNRDTHQSPENVIPTIADIEMEPRQGDNYNEDTNVYEELRVNNENTIEYESLSTENPRTTLSDITYENLEIKG